MDDTVVLIENQLETTNHTHLGQIMTYLAGLEVQTVVWIAPAFREPHLSAIRWLNEHTADGFSFFAIKARVVRISDSPFAPIFEVVEKPNDWGRHLKPKASQSEGASYYDVKQRFGEELLKRHPGLADAGCRVWRYPNNYVIVHEEPEITLSVFIGKTASGIFVRSGHGEPAEPVIKLLEPFANDLETRTGTTFGPFGKRDHVLFKTLPKGHIAQDAWPEIMDWMNENVALFREALHDALEAAKK